MITDRVYALPLVAHLSRILSANKTCLSARVHASSWLNCNLTETSPILSFTMLNSSLFKIPFGGREKRTHITHLCGNSTPASTPLTHSTIPFKHSKNATIAKSNLLLCNILPKCKSPLPYSSWTVTIFGFDADANCSIRENEPMGISRYEGNVYSSFRAIV